MSGVKELLMYGIENIKGGDPVFGVKLGEAQIMQAFQMMTHKDVTENDDVDSVIEKYPDCGIQNFLKL